MTHSPVTDQLEEFWSLIKGQGAITVVMLTPQSDQMFEVNELLKHVQHCTILFLILFTSLEFVALYNNILT